jgi:hypothetical protein
MPTVLRSISRLRERYYSEKMTTRILVTTSLSGPESFRAPGVRPLAQIKHCVPSGLKILLESSFESNITFWDNIQIQI